MTAQSRDERPIEDRIRESIAKKAEVLAAGPARSEKPAKRARKKS